MTESSRPHRLRQAWPLIAAAVALSLAAGAVGAVAYRELGDRSGACDAKRLAVKANPSLVALLSETPDHTPFANGIIIQSDGVILAPSSPTSAVGGSQLVELPNGETVSATIAGTDPLYGLDLLRIPRTDLPALLLSWNNDLAVGDPVAVFGSPLSSSANLAAATVSALNLTVETNALDGPSSARADVIRFDGGFTPNLTGGAVLNCDGQLVAVAMAAPSTDGATTLHEPGYALAATTARRISQAILGGTPLTHPWVGADVAQVSQDVAAQYHAPAGMVIRATEHDGPAAKAGLQPGDVITAINGQAANSITWSRWWLTVSTGGQVRVDYSRSGKPGQTQLTVINQPEMAVVR